MYGTKANNLILLKKAGFNVPKFTCFPEYNLPIFFDIESEFNKPLIIRSSYSIEDGKTNAFAGIFESYFPIYNEKDYNKGLDICINADKLDKFKNYVEINKIDISKMKKNFILQEFIVGDFSGVCFTNTKEKNILIEIVPGLNEPLVQGKVKNPFIIRINRNNIKEYNIDSFYMDRTYKTLKYGKIVENNFNKLLFEENILLKFKNRLLYIFLKIEKLFGYPQDIEFTVKGNDIYILQSRNITVL